MYCCFQRYCFPLMIQISQFSGNSFWEIFLLINTHESRSRTTNEHDLFFHHVLDQTILVYQFSPVFLMQGILQCFSDQTNVSFLQCWKKTCCMRGIEYCIGKWNALWKNASGKMCAQFKIRNKCTESY